MTFYRLGMLSALLTLAFVPAGSRAATATPAPAPTPSGCSTPLHLTLRPGLHVPNSRVSDTPAPDIPPGPVPVDLPLYPGARPATLPMPLAQYGVPLSRYLKSASAEYETPGGWTAADTWYRRSFGACGYAVAGYGSSGVRGRTVSTGLVFRDPRHSSLDVALAFTHGPPGTTLVLYFAYTIVFPAPSAMVPGDPRSVTILSYGPLVQGRLAASRPKTYVVVRDARSIAELARHVNGLPRPGGVMSCPADNGSHDELVFAYPDGHKVRVDVGLSGCRIVRSGDTVGTALSDNGLYVLLSALLARPSAVHLGFPFDARSLRLAAGRANTGDGLATFLAWNPGGTEYLYLDRGALWVADRDNRWHRRIARGPVAQGAFDPSGDFVYRSLVRGGPGPLTVAAQQSRLEHYRYVVRWAPSTPNIGTQAGMGTLWSNGLVTCSMQLWFVQGRHLIGIDPHYRTDTYRPPLRLPALTPATRIAVSCDGLLAAIATPAGGLEIREMQSGKLIRRVPLPSAVTGLSWGTDNRTLAYVTGGVNGQVGTIDTRTGRHHLLARLNRDTIEGMTWDPYAHTLAFARLHRTALAGEIDVVNVNGSGMRALDRQPGMLAAMPQWSSRGGVIGYTLEALGGGVRRRTDVWLDYLSTPHPYPAPAVVSDRASG